MFHSIPWRFQSQTMNLSSSFAPILLLLILNLIIIIQLNLSTKRFSFQLPISSFLIYQQHFSLFTLSNFTHIATGSFTTLCISEASSAEVSGKTTCRFSFCFFFFFFFLLITIQNELKTLIV